MEAMCKVFNPLYYISYYVRLQYKTDIVKLSIPSCSLLM